MREALDQWAFVAAAYAVGVLGTIGMIAWSWLSMRRAEKRRDRTRER